MTKTEQLEQALIAMYIPPCLLDAQGSVTLYLFTVG